MFRDVLIAWNGNETFSTELIVHSKSKFLSLKRTSFWLSSGSSPQEFVSCSREYVQRFLAQQCQEPRSDLSALSLVAVLIIQRLPYYPSK